MVFTVAGVTVDVVVCVAVAAVCVLETVVVVLPCLPCVPIRLVRAKAGAVDRASERNTAVKTNIFFIGQTLLYFPS